jgi:hypothetical protein
MYRLPPWIVEWRLVEGLKDIFEYSLQQVRQLSFEHVEQRFDEVLGSGAAGTGVPGVL